MWKLGDRIIPCAENYYHLDIIINKKSQLLDKIITTRKGPIRLQTKEQYTNALMFLKHFVCEVAVFLPKRDLIFESVFNVISIKSEINIRAVLLLYRINCDTP